MPPLIRAPSMGNGYRVQVSEGGGRSDLSEAPGHSCEGVSGGSVEREERADEQEPDRRRRLLGERANDREAPATERRRRRSGGRALKVDGLTWGDLALRLKGRRREGSEKSAEARRIPPEAGERPNGRESEATVSLGGGWPQESGQLELPFGRPGEAWGAGRREEPLTAANGDARSGTWHT